MRNHLRIAVLLIASLAAAGASAQSGEPQKRAFAVAWEHALRAVYDGTFPYPFSIYDGCRLAVDCGTPRPFGHVLLRNGTLAIAASRGPNPEGYYAGNRIDLFDPPGPVRIGALLDIDPRDLVEERSGSLIVVGNELGTSTPARSLIVRASLVDGRTARIGTLPGPVGDDVSIDLASDGCTLFYTRAPNVIARHDICSDKELSAFAVTNEGSIEQIKILPNGGVLAAVRTAVLRFDGGDGVVQRYAVGELGEVRAVALGDDARSFWTASAVRLRFDAFVRFDLATGAEVERLEHDGLPQAGRLSIAGEPRAAFAPSSVPTLSPRAAIALAAAIASVAMRFMR